MKSFAIARGDSGRVDLARPSDELRRVESMETIHNSAFSGSFKQWPEDVVHGASLRPIGIIKSKPTLAAFLMNRLDRDYHSCLRYSIILHVVLVVVSFLLMLVLGALHKLAAIFDSLVYIYLRVSLGLSPTSERVELRNHHSRLRDIYKSLLPPIMLVAGRIGEVVAYLRSCCCPARPTRETQISSASNSRSNSLQRTSQLAAADRSTMRPSSNAQGATKAGQQDDGRASSNWALEAYYRSKKYAFVIINCASLVLAFFDPHRKASLNLDKLCKLDINDVRFTIIFGVVLTVFTYLNYQMAHVIRNDIGDYLQILIRERITVLDNHFTFKRSFIDIVADLNTYGYVVLNCENHMDIWLVSKDFSHLKKDTLNELIRENYFYDNRTFRKVRVRTKGLLECPAYHKTSYLVDDSYVRVSTWSLGLDWHSVDPRKANFDICLHDMKIYDILSFVALALFYFTSLTLVGYWRFVFAGFLLCFVLLAFRRLRTYQVISLAEFTVLNEFRRVQHLEVKAGIPEEYRPLRILRQQPAFTLFDNMTVFRAFKEMFLFLLLCQTKQYPRQSLQGLNVVQLFDFYSSVSNSTAVRVIFTYNGVPIFKIGGANADAINNTVSALRIQKSTYENPLIIKLDDEGTMDIDEDTQDNDRDEYVLFPDNLGRDVLYYKTNTIRNSLPTSRTPSFSTPGISSQQSKISSQDNPMNQKQSNGAVAPGTRNPLNNQINPRDSINSRLSASRGTQDPDNHAVLAAFAREPTFGTTRSSLPSEDTEHKDVSPRESLYGGRPSLSSRHRHDMITNSHVSFVNSEQSAYLTRVSIIPGSTQDAGSTSNRASLAGSTTHN
jgi:Ca2+/Na+ antiporter